MATALRSIGSFLKWRLVPVRYLGRVRYLKPDNLFASYAPTTPAGIAIERDGYVTGPTASPDLLKRLQDRFLPRAPTGSGKDVKAPFTNLSRAEDFDADSPLMQLAFSPEVLDVALDYYGRHCRLDKLQVLYSYATTDGALKESQMWHLDYTDSRSLHCVMYLTDVLRDEDGPFVFVDKQESRRISRGPIIRRIDDAQLRKELGDGTIRTVYGKAGESIIMDPAACYHYGSRCRNPRVAVFATFGSDKPFNAPLPLMKNNAGRILAAAKTLRPDLSPSVLERLLDI